MMLSLMSAFNLVSDSAKKTKKIPIYGKQTATAVLPKASEI